jgi:hypothetical protein
MLAHTRKADLRLAADPVRMLEQADITPDGWQAAVLRSQASRSLLLCSRQSGKSTIAAAVALHTALYQPGALVLLLSPSLRQSGELFKKSVSLYRALGRPVSAEAETALTLVLENGSRVVSLPGKEQTIRGFSGVSLLVIDEAARVDDSLYHSTKPMLAVSNGRLLALSTPWGRRGFFYDAWENGGDAWERVRITAHECPRISPGFLAEERRSMPDLFFRSEYLCEFCDTIDAVFATEYIEAAFDPTITPLFGGGA